MRSPMLWSEALLGLGIVGTSLQRSFEISSFTLKPRKMHKSYAELALPFASSPATLDKRAPGPRSRTSNFRGSRGFAPILYGMRTRSVAAKERRNSMRGDTRTETPF